MGSLAKPTKIEMTAMVAIYCLGHEAKVGRRHDMI
jgi:hypothetical protein